MEFILEKLAIIYDERHSKHAPFVTHPERPERVSSTIEYLQKNSFLNEIKLFTPPEASKDVILRVHTEKHYEHVLSSISSGKPYLDEDTYIVKDSLQPALLSSGSAVKAVDLVMDKSFKSVFSLMRPPGHHAETFRSMGFCIFNNAAIGAQYAIDKYNLSRIAIIDWDVHHGNGTQEIFYERSDVYYFSLHQYPLYPGTGSHREQGAKTGMGFTMNFPLRAGTTGKPYIEIFQKMIIKELEKYSPELIIISAGFDAHEDDPLAEMSLNENDFAELTRIVKDFCNDRNIPLISLLEGGYNLDALARSVYAHLKVLNE
jgi:acetoin utilization deacetylase AcuC-like enzyme